ncbi:CPBP family intramembrane metalloprotease [candidate division KSB1 bacterium]|nr:CPBP family intramembrane metalloprotease [candidate division KSB1 bacterium]
MDAWIASDGFQGYKIGHSQPLQMLFGGPDAIAVDMEIFKRAGVDWQKSQILDRCIKQVHDGSAPGYRVMGDVNTKFADLTDWQNIKDETVRDIDIFEEVYVAWGIINMTPVVKHFDYTLFPPKNMIYKFGVWFTKKMYAVLKATSLIKKWYRRRMSPDEMKRIEDGEFDSSAILAIVWASLKKLGDKAAIIMWTSILFLMIWGLHGNMEILHGLLDKPFGEDWTQKITFGLAWGEQLVSFVVGFILAVALPCLIIKIRFKESLKDYGLGLPKKEDYKKSWVAFASLFGFTSLFIFAASFNGEMQAEYPLFGDTITSWSGFLIYELVYLLFFISIEFAFRGYLLFGLHRIKMDGHTVPPVLRFGVYAILIQMLAYTTWHYGKPPLEMGGTIAWGIAAAAIALRIRSLWPIIIAHWLYNVLLDLLIWKDIPQKLSGN